MSADPRIALYQCALGVAKDAMEAFTDPDDRMPADTGEFRDLKIALVAIRQVLPGCEEYKSAPDLLAERDQLKALNAELAEALYLLDETGHFYGWQDARGNLIGPQLEKVLAKQKDAT